MTLDAQTHYFIAVPLPKSVKETFATYMKEQKRHFPFTRWVHPEDLHLTLAFLGGVKEQELDNLLNQIHATVALHQPFRLTLNELGTFGNPQSPKIFWYGVEKSASLHALRDDIYVACEQAGFSLDQRPFHPHITMARKWKGPGSINEELLVSESVLTDSFQVHDIVLYETHVNKMPRYEVKEKFSLL